MAFYWNFPAHRAGKEGGLMIALDCNMRLVKGHVFLWQGAADWYNLWDQNGDIDRTGWER